MAVFREKYISKGHIACYVVFLPKKNWPKRFDSHFFPTVLVPGMTDANPPVNAHSAGNQLMKGLHPCSKLVL
jgi:hypothetical protein